MNPTAHQSLLIACATSHPDAFSRRQVDTALAREDLDWTLLLTRSIRHGLAQHAALHLGEWKGDPRLPGDVSACLERMLRANGHRNAVLFREASRLLRAFDAAGIPCLLLKGMPLAVTVYPDPALRNFADIDLLVNSADYDAAGEAARSCGFLEDDPALSLGGVHQRRTYHCSEDILTDTLPVEFDSSLTREELAPHCRRVVIEIHRGLLRDALGCWIEQDLNLLLEDSQDGQLPDGCPFRMLSPEGMLAHLAMHARQHTFQRLMYLLDMRELLRRKGAGMNPNRVRALARICQAERDLDASLTLIRHDLGAPVPEALLAPGLTAPRVGWSRQRVTLPFILDTMEAGPHEFMIRQWLLARTPWLSPPGLWRRLLPSRSSVERNYGVSGLLPLLVFYPSRFLRLIGVLLRILTGWMTRRLRK